MSRPSGRLLHACVKKNYIKRTVPILLFFLKIHVFFTFFSKNHYICDKYRFSTATSRHGDYVTNNYQH